MDGEAEYARPQGPLAKDVVASWKSWHRTAVNDMEVPPGSVRLGFFKHCYFSKKNHLSSQKYHPGWLSKPVDSGLSQASLATLPPFFHSPTILCHEMAEMPAALGQGMSWGGEARLKPCPEPFCLCPTLGKERQGL